MNDIKLGDKVICRNGISGVVVQQYYPTCCSQQTMIKTLDGRLYHAPTDWFTKIGNANTRQYCEGYIQALEDILKCMKRGE